MNYHGKVFEDWVACDIGDATRPWQDRFPNFGMCMVDPMHMQAFIPIPRCGSQFLCKFLANKYKWVGSHSLIYQRFLVGLSKWKPDLTFEQKYFTIVRDPLERYISALWIHYDKEKQEMKKHNMSSKTQMDHLFSDPSMNDHHTINQYNFFYNLNLDQVAFFDYNDKNTGDKLSHYLKKECNIDFLPEQWISRLSEEKEDIYKLLDANPKYMDNVKKYLEDDYKFLSTIKYYEPN